MAVVKFRPFKIPPDNTVSSFSPIKISDLKEYMESDLARSGLVPEDIHAYVHTKAVPKGVKRSYIIPYFDTEGQPIVDDGEFPAMWRKKVDPPQEKSKYFQPRAQDLLARDLPPFVPYILPQSLSIKGETLFICEGEKKTAAFMKLVQEPAIGIGGCRMWHDPAGSGGVHPWIAEVIRGKGYEKVTVIPDGDLWQHDICKSYGDFTRALESLGCEVEIIDLSGQDLKGVDDYLVRWGLEGPSMLLELPRLKPSDLHESPDSLLERYKLPFKELKVGKVPLEKSATVTILLEQHPAFPKIWRNLDTQSVFIGDKPVQDGVTDMEIANYFQTSFGMSTVHQKLVRECLATQAGKNERSPFLDRVRSTNWDGIPRLETWLIDHWGIEDEPFAREVAVKWMVGSVNRLDVPGSKMDWMFIVTGGQGTGKSSMPSILFDSLDVVMYGEHHDKDLHMKLHSGLCIVVDELDSLNKKEATYWKSVLTSNSDKFRAPYAATVSEYPRRSVMYGTSNVKAFLAADPSGYRRYAILSTETKLDFEWLKEWRWQLWAEAYTIYLGGECEHWELEGVQEAAEQHDVENPMVQMVEACLDMRKSDEPFQMKDVLAWLGKEDQMQNRALTREVSNALTECGYARNNKSSRIDGVVKKGRWTKKE